MEHIIEQESEVMSIQPRSALLAFLFSVLTPGLGQLYNGQFQKAMIYWGIYIIAPMIFSISHGATTFYGLMIFCSIIVGLNIYFVIDAIYHARQLQSYVLKPYNTWYAYAFFVLMILFIFMFYDVQYILGIQEYRVPTTSCNPTLQTGDRLIADIKAYKKNAPNYGDIVLYSAPYDVQNTYWVSRIVGLPNDNIAMKNNVLYVNGKPCLLTFTQDTVINDEELNEYEEELPNGHKHLLYKYKKPHPKTKSNFESITIPSGSYFLLGDNRDNSIDSRFLGFIVRDKILGRFMYSYWGEGKDRINIDFNNK